MHRKGLVGGGCPRPRPRTQQAERQARHTALPCHHSRPVLFPLALPAPALQLGLGESQMLDKILYEEEVRQLAATYEQQFHYGTFYAYMRLR